MSSRLHRARPSYQGRLIWRALRSTGQNGASTQVDSSLTEQPEFAAELVGTIDRFELRLDRGHVTLRRQHTVHQHQSDNLHLHQTNTMQLHETAQAV